MKLKIFLLILGLILLAVLIITARPTELDNSAWVLVELNGKPIETFLREPYFGQNFEPFEDFHITLRFSKNKIIGTNACNDYEGYYFTLWRYLFKSKVFINLVSCAFPKEILKQSDDYNQALGHAIRYQIKGDQLKLLGLDKHVLAVFNIQTQELAGSQWNVVYFIDSRQIYVYPFTVNIKKKVTPAVGTTISLRFIEDQLLGNVGCNDYFGWYKSDGSIQITKIDLGDMACPGPAGLMYQEAGYFEALRTVTGYRVDGDYLELLTAEGETAIYLRIAP